MDKAQAISSPPFAIGRGYSVEFRLEGTRMDVVWSPGLPTGRRGRQLLPAYRKARDAYLRSIATTRGDILVVEA